MTPAWKKSESLGKISFVCSVVSGHSCLLLLPSCRKTLSPLSNVLPVCTASRHNQSHKAGQPCIENRSQINFPPLQCPQDVTRSSKSDYYVPNTLLESRLLDIRLSCSIFPVLHHLHIFRWSKVVNTFETWPERARSRNHNSYSHWPNTWSF